MTKERADAIIANAEAIKDAVFNLVDHRERAVQVAILGEDSALPLNHARHFVRRGAMIEDPTPERLIAHVGFMIVEINAVSPTMRVTRIVQADPSKEIYVGDDGLIGIRARLPVVGHGAAGDPPTGG